MEAFFATQVGKILAGCLIFVGITDGVIGKLLFGKQLDKAWQALQTTGDLAEQEKLQNRIKGLQIIQRTIIGTGILFILLGIFGISR